MDLFISAVFVLAIIGYLLRYSWFLGKKSGYELGCEQGVNNWISVKDRLPEDGFSHCLFYVEREDVCCVGGVHKGVIQANDEDCFHNNITHWMPLPEPPSA